MSINIALKLSNNSTHIINCISTKKCYTDLYDYNTQETEICEIRFSLNYSNWFKNKEYFP